eukprot:764012-Hanusia_phi.AAC.1
MLCTKELYMSTCRGEHVRQLLHEYVEDRSCNVEGETRVAWGHAEVLPVAALDAKGSQHVPAAGDTLRNACEEREREGMQGRGEEGREKRRKVQVVVRNKRGVRRKEKKRLSRAGRREMKRSELSCAVLEEVEKGVEGK